MNDVWLNHIPRCKTTTTNKFSDYTLQLEWWAQEWFWIAVTYPEKCHRSTDAAYRDGYRYMWE